MANSLDICEDLAPYGFPLKESSDLGGTIQRLLDCPDIAQKKGQEMRRAIEAYQHQLPDLANELIERMRSAHI